MPTLIPVTTSVSDADSGHSRDGETDVVRRDCHADGLCLPLIAADGLAMSQQAVFDQAGGGAVSGRFVIRGRTPSGSRFVLARSDAEYSADDAPDAGISGLYGALSALGSDRFGSARVTSVHAESSMTTRKLATTVTDVETASSLEPALTRRRTLVMLPGDTIRIHVNLRPAQPGNAVRSVDLRLRVPRHGGSFSYVVVGSGERTSLPRPGPSGRLWPRSTAPRTPPTWRRSCTCSVTAAARARRRRHRRAASSSGAASFASWSSAGASARPRRGEARAARAARDRRSPPARR